jgi:DNA-binding FadR family transcriptional regulator
MSSEYEVGPPAIREALRILENEGLITVLRGNVGGAEVHSPTNEAVAYGLSLVLRSSQVPVTDFIDAMRELEALCAALCARRSDRGDTLVPLLRAIHAESEAALNGPGTVFEKEMRRFHVTLSENCANQTLSLLTSIIQRLWSAQRDTWTRHVTQSSDWPPMDLRLRGLRYHAQVVDAVERGDPVGAAEIMRELAAHPKHFGPFVIPHPMDGPDGHFTGKLQSAKASVPRESPREARPSIGSRDPLKE